MAIDTEEQTTTPSKDGKVKTGTSKSNKKVITIVLVVVGILIILGILGSLLTGYVFKKGAEGFIGAATGDKVKIDDGEVTIKGEDGADLKVNTGSSAKLSEGFPKSDVPVYKGAKIESSSDITVEGSTAYTVVLSTKDSVSDVMEFYKSKLSSGDWKKSFSSNSSYGSTSNFTSESKKMAVTITASDDKDEANTSITLSVRVGDF